MSKLELPVKRGTFIEFRNGLINICPPGRSVSQEHRDSFGDLDKEKQIRLKFVDALQEELGLHFAIGGQISIDAFPHGWDKRFCLKYVEKKFKDIHIYGDQRTTGHAVKDPQDTCNQLKALFDL